MVKKKMRRKEEAGIERKVAPRSIKEYLLKTSREANALPKFKMQVANAY